MKVMVVTGASGGHIFPALSFIRYCREAQAATDVLLVAPEKAGKFLDGVPCPVRTISIVALPRKVSADFFMKVCACFKGCFQSLSILASYRPDRVIAFGSIACIPLVVGAWLFRIPTVIHEQNVVPGKANRLLSRCADVVAVSFEETKRFICRPAKEACVVTGNPLRPQMRVVDKASACSFFGFRCGRFTFLVMGGSQGSRRINEAFVQWFKTVPGRNFQCIHLTGEQDYAYVKAAYEEMRATVFVAPFLKEMEQAYSASDFIIARAGATTLAELMYYRVPAVLIPYPFAGAHQVYNAEVLRQMKAARVIVEDEHLQEHLNAQLAEIVSDPAVSEAMRRAYPETEAHNPAERLFSIVEGAFS